MTTFSEHWKLEEQFWLGGPEVYREGMMADARMIFAEPVGFLRGEEILHALEGGPRWQSVAIENKSEIQVGDTVVLAYKATGLRGASNPYVALCSSTYVRQNATWKLLAHQQTPLG